MFKIIADFLTYGVFRLEGGGHFASSVNYFFYDVFKIFTLIFVVVTVIAFFRTFLNPHKVRDAALKTKWGLGNLVAALFGAVTPFCSCSSVPLFIGFVKAGVPLSVAFSFIITSPLVNEVVFVMMGGMFGWKLAGIYAITGILLGVIGGLLIGAFAPKDGIILEKGEGAAGMSGAGAAGAAKIRNLPKTFDGRIRYAFKDGSKTFKKLFFYVLVGVAIGALIHGYVPQDFFVNYIGKFGIFAVPVAVIIGVPIYAGCATAVPIILSITASGVPLGTSLAFLMAIAGLSLPEAVMLKRVLSYKLLAIFFGIVAVGIIFIGYLFNFLQGLT